jgi:hypothetical protein
VGLTQLCIINHTLEDLNEKGHGFPMAIEMTASNLTGNFAGGSGSGDCAAFAALFAESGEFVPW